MLTKKTSSTIFLRLWYDSTWDWTPVSRTIGEHSNHYTNGPVYINIYTRVCVCVCDLALNNSKGLISHKTQPTNQPIKIMRNHMFLSECVYKITFYELNTHRLYAKYTLFNVRQTCVSRRCEGWVERVNKLTAHFSVIYAAKINKS